MFQLRLPATMPVCCCTVAKFDQTGQSLMTSQTSVGTALAHNILDRVETLLLEAEEALKPLELDPYRSRLFELFVMADAAGFLDEDAAPDLASRANFPNAGTSPTPPAVPSNSSPSCLARTFPKCGNCGRSCGCGWSGRTPGTAGTSSTTAGRTSRSYEAKAPAFRSTPIAFANPGEVCRVY
jgi:hypothetical protein